MDPFKDQVPYADALDLVNEGLARISSQNDLDLFCYSRHCFLNQLWSDQTKQLRGQLYHKQVPVNRPFHKMFNVGEVPEASVETVQSLVDAGHEYHIHDKVNGHLLIMSAFVEPDTGRQRAVFSHKGSLWSADNDMLINDSRIAQQYSEQLDRLIAHDKLKNMTLMFEVLSEQDQHAMYSKQVEQYGGSDILILLGGYVWVDQLNGWYPIDQTEVESLSAMIGCPHATVHHFDLDPGWYERLIDHKNREGYVIWFPELDYRIKIKTRYYWKARFAHKMTPTSLMRKFAKGGVEAIYDVMPEEINQLMIDFLQQLYVEWKLKDVDEIDPDILKGVIPLSDNRCSPLTSDQKRFVNLTQQGQSVDEIFVLKRATATHERSAFANWVVATHQIDDRLDELVDRILHP